jgi:DNA-directed RNA polymerase
MSDIDNTLERRLKAEYFKADNLGFGCSAQGLALAKRYRAQLAQIITADRAGPPKPLPGWESLQKRWRPDRELWRALKDLDADDIAWRLLMAGVSVCYNERLGIDDNDIKNHRDIAIVIGACLGRRGRIGLRLGAWGIDMLTLVPIFERDDDGVLSIPLTDELDETLTDAIRALVVHSPFLEPLAHPPVPWTGFDKGGLPSDYWAKIELIRGCHPAQRNAVIKAIGTGKMKPALDAIAALQNTAFTVNQPVLEFVKRSAAPPVLNKKLVERTDWLAKQELAAIYAQNMVWVSDITVAETAPAQFFVPLVLDFRGRLYGVPSFNFGRTDYVRAMFLFADGEPINEEGLIYLKAHCAAKADGNVWSRVRKPSELDLEGRIAWTEENLPMLLKIGNSVLCGDNPQELDWLLSAIDDRYQFVAACTELAPAIASFGDDAGFVSRLPLSFDATNSAGQHYSAMTSSEDEGRFVNLTGPEAGTFTALDPITNEKFSNTVSGAGDDLYRRIIFEVWQEWQSLWPELENWKAAYGVDSETPKERQHRERFIRARKLFDAFDRSLVKRAVVAYFYGSRAGKFEKVGDDFVASGMTEMIAEVLEERKQFVGHASTLAKLTQDAIKKVMPKACEARSFLRRLARRCSKHNKPFRWTTATGMPVINAYFEKITERVKTPKKNRISQITLTIGNTDNIVPQDAVRAAPANFVHSLDASHLHLIALAAAAENIPLVAVHDSFATIATRAKRLNEIIREQFVVLHGCDWLNVARESVRHDLPKTAELPPRPKRGTLDITDVLRNFRAFS